MKYRRCDGTGNTVLDSRWIGCLAALVILIAAFSAQGQLAGKGAIAGTVTDRTGAVVPNVTVAVTNTATGITTTTQTTGTGDYTFSNLDPGIYSLTASAPGFEKLVQENIHVNAMEKQTYNAALTVGVTTTSVTVTSEPPQLETIECDAGRDDGTGNLRQVTD